MLIRTLRATERAGRPVRAFACLDLPREEAMAMIEAGMAEAWDPEAPATPTPVAPADVLGGVAAAVTADLPE